MLFIIFTCLILCLIGYLVNREITTEEFLGMCAITILASLIVYGLTIIPYPNDIYYESGRYNRVEHHPYFKERYQQAHTICHSCGKSTCCHTYYTTEYEKHPEYWIVFDSLGQSKLIDYSQYRQIAKAFGDNQLISRGVRYHHSEHKCVQGDSNLYYYVNQTNTYNYPTTKISRWHNPLRRKISLFNTEKELVKEYPRQFNWTSNERLQSGKTTRKDWDILNTKLYEKLGVNVNLIEVESIDLATQIKYSWNSGKKNDINILVGKDGVLVFGWYKSEILSTKLEDYILENGINLKGIEHIILSYYQEFDFKTFNYLKQPELWQLVLTGIITLIIMIACYVYFSQNEYYRDEDGNTHYDFWRRY